MTAKTPSPVTVRVRGLSVYAYHGAMVEERTLGQRFEFDVDVLLDDCVACRSDELGDTVDYAAITALVAEVATGFRFNLLEALADAVCLELLTEFPVSRVRLAVRKMSPPVRHPVASAEIEVERTRAHLAAADAVRPGEPAVAERA